MAQRNTVIQLLTSLINGSNLQQTQSKLSELSKSAGYGMMLLSIFCNENGNGKVDGMIRHQAGIILKNFLSENWLNERIEEVEKNSIKANILNKSLFEDQNSKIRKTTAMIISVLAEFDYPEKWNNLLNVILSFIKESCQNQNIFLLSGSIDTLRYFIEHICDLQLPTIGPILFPLLLRICCEKSINAKIRFDALSVYHSLLSSTLEMRMIDPAMTKNLINDTLLKYLKFMNSDILSVQNESMLSLQILSLKIVNDITKSYSLSIVNCLPMMLNSTWKLMLFYSDKSNVNEESADNVYSFYDEAFVWIYTILRHKRSEIGTLLDDKLNDISSLIIKLLKYCEDDTDLFEDCPNEFIVNEENIYYQNNLRSLIRGVIINILEIRPLTAFYSLLQSAKRSLSSSASLSTFDREAVLLVFGYLAQFNHHLSSKKDFKIEQFLQTVLWKHLHCTNDRLLQYRALWTLNKFIFSLNVEAKKQILPQICACIKNSNPLCVQYQGIKCFESIILSNNSDKINLDGLLGGVLPLLCHLLKKMDASTLKYLLKSLSVIVRCNKAKCSEYESVIVPLIIDLWSKHSLNQDITHYLKSVISVYAQIESCQQNVIKHIVPTILTILNPNNKDCDGSVIVCSLEILHILMINSFKTATNNELNIVFYKEFLPLVLNLVYKTTEREVMNIGAQILCLFINFNAQFIVNGKVKNESMIQFLCKIISKFLSPQIPETASKGIGPLITQLIMNLKGALNESMFTTLLLTIIGRINNCKTTTLRNELILVFARLVHEYGNVRIIAFLAKHEKLSNILTFWCSNHNDFIYPYYKKVSVTALAKIVQTNHGLISNLSFDGYPIINMNAPRSSRSKSQRLQFTKMPFIVKFFQILVNTYRDLVDCHFTSEDAIDYEDDEEEDDEEENDGEDIDDEEEEESEDEEDYVPEESGEESDEDYDDNESEQTDNDDELAMLKRQSRNHANENKNDDQKLLNRKKVTSPSAKSVAKDIELELCPEAINDKIFYMDFKKWSKDFTQKLSNQNGQAFQRVISMLNQSDKNILKDIVN